MYNCSLWLNLHHLVVSYLYWSCLWIIKNFLWISTKTISKTCFVASFASWWDAFNTGLLFSPYKVLNDDRWGNTSATTSGSLWRLLCICLGEGSHCRKQLQMGYFCFSTFHIWAAVAHNGRTAVSFSCLSYPCFLLV